MEMMIFRINLYEKITFTYSYGDDNFRINLYEKITITIKIFGDEKKFCHIFASFKTLMEFLGQKDAESMMKKNENYAISHCLIFHVHRLFYHVFGPFFSKCLKNF